MKVRVFLPTDEALEAFPFGEFDFEAMPREGQILRFAELENADYPIEKVGFIQEDMLFVAAVWLGPPRPRGAILDVAEAGDELPARIA